MKRILSILLFIPLFAVSQQNTQVETQQIDNVNIFVIHSPAENYENLGSVNLKSTDGELNDRLIKLVAMAKETYGNDVSAIYTRSGQVAQCIKFDAPSATAKQITIGEHVVYLYAQPTAKYSVVASITSDVYTDKNIPQGSMKMQEIIKEAELKYGQIDAAISMDGTTFDLIRF